MTSPKKVCVGGYFTLGARGFLCLLFPYANVDTMQSCRNFTTSFRLHWLPVFYRIYFKILILTFKSIHNMSPSYIRSNSSLILDRTKGSILSTLGARSFYAAVPTLWNSLPANIRDITSLNIFKKNLKTYLFSLAYNK